MILINFTIKKEFTILLLKRMLGELSSENYAVESA